MILYWYKHYKNRAFLKIPRRMYGVSIPECCPSMPGRYGQIWIVTLVGEMSNSSIDLKLYSPAIAKAWHEFGVTDILTAKEHINPFRTSQFLPEATTGGLNVVAF